MSIDTVLGLDISTHMGVALLGMDGTELYTGEVHVPLRFGPKKERRHAMDRARGMATKLEAILDKYDKSRMLTVIEGYGFSRTQGPDSIVTTVEVGTNIRQLLHFSYNLPWIEVPPSTLKNFVTCPGNAKKALVIEAVERVWGFQSKNDNIVDAYSLAQLGRSLCGAPAPVGKKVQDALTVVAGLEVNQPAFASLKAVQSIAQNH